MSAYYVQETSTHDFQECGCKVFALSEVDDLLLDSVRGVPKFETEH